MRAYIVTYDLLRQGQNYHALTKRLESYPVHWHVQQSVWIIATDQSAVDVRAYLLPTLDGNDKLIVARLEGEAAWAGYPDNVNSWLRDRLQAKVS
jgi:hypothetical protein